MVGCYFITPSIFRTDTLAPKPDCILAGRVTLRTSFYIFPLLRRQPSLHSLPWKSVEHAQKTEMSVLSTLFGEQTPRYRLYTQLFKRGYTRFLQRSGFASKDLASCNEGLIFLFQFLPSLSSFFLLLLLLFRIFPTGNPRSDCNESFFVDGASRNKRLKWWTLTSIASGEHTGNRWIFSMGEKLMFSILYSLLDRVPLAGFMARSLEIAIFH